jgi:STE24 endopeptidase
MNVYSWIIIVALLGSFLLGIISELLNLSALRPDLPEEFEAVYDADAYSKSQNYTRTTTKFGFIVGSFDLVVLLLFWFSGLFNRLDQFVGGFVQEPILVGLAYIGILLLLKFLVSVPFSIYSTFVIEERFGFNRTTPATFIGDILKGSLLTIVLGGGIMACVLAIFEYGGPYAWLYCWGAVTGFSLILQFIAPTWIMPLFNKFKPLEDGELKEKIMSYAQSVKFSLENVFVMDGSKRSSKSNAFFTGFGKHKRIALFDTLIEKHSVSELVGVLAHEIGHYKKKHIIQGMCLGIVHMGVMFYLISIFLTHQGLFDAFYMDQKSIYAGFIFFGLLFSPIELILSLFTNMLSRANEFEADRFAVTTCGSGEPLILALKKLSVHNLANLTPHPFYVFLNYSHPPLLERIKAIKSVKL